MRILKSRDHKAHEEVLEIVMDDQDYQKLFDSGFFSKFPVVSERNSIPSVIFYYYLMAKNLEKLLNESKANSSEVNDEVG